jgi:protein SMG9
MYVTGSRMVLLDTPPTCASTVMDYVGTTSQLDKKLAGELAPSSSENASELQSTQISAFLMAVCHVVILIDDWLVDTGALR